MLNLSERLRMICESVPVGSKVADIGTDHAFLPIALIESGRAKSVIASDIAKGPLRTARKNISLHNTDNIELRISDGLEKIEPKEADVITICGMGGDVITGILKRADWIKEYSPLLILQSMSSTEELRDYLTAEGFFIESERAVCDKKRVYSIIVARYNGVKVQCSGIYRYIGKMAENLNDSEEVYIKFQYKRICDCQKALKGVETKRDEYNRYSDLKDDFEEFFRKNGVDY